MGDQLAVAAKRFPKVCRPCGDFVIAFCQNLAYQTLKSLRQRRVGDSAIVLVEFARCEEAAWGHECLVQFTNYGGFANAGVTRNEHKLDALVSDNAIEGRQQRVYLAVASIQFFGNDKAV